MLFLCIFDRENEENQDLLTLLQSNTLSKLHTLRKVLLQFMLCFWLQYSPPREAPRLEHRIPTSQTWVVASLH